MTRDEIINLLSIAAAYDKRTIGEADLAAFTDAAERGRWGYEQAAEAIKTHYAHTSEWLMPAHINQRIKEHRAEPSQTGRSLPRGSADAEHIRRSTQWLASQLDANRHRTTSRREALSVACPRCGAEPGASCVQTTGAHGHTRTGRIPIEQPHTARRHAARDGPSR